MAITWDIQISNVNVASKRADVSFTRTDDVTNETENYRFSNTIIETAAQRAALLDQVWGEHLNAVTKQTVVDTFITNLEQLAKSNLESREV